MNIEKQLISYSGVDWEELHITRNTLTKSLKFLVIGEKFKRTEFSQELSKPHHDNNKTKMTQD